MTDGFKLCVWCQQVFCLSSLDHEFLSTYFPDALVESEDPKTEWTCMKCAAAQIAAGNALYMAFRQTGGLKRTLLSLALRWADIIVQPVVVHAHASTAPAPKSEEA